jgi:hypothetical protein
MSHRKPICEKFLAGKCRGKCDYFHPKSTGHNHRGSKPTNPRHPKHYKEHVEYQEEQIHNSYIQENQARNPVSTQAQVHCVRNPVSTQAQVHCARNPVSTQHTTYTGYNGISSSPDVLQAHPTSVVDTAEQTRTIG